MTSEMAWKGIKTWKCKSTLKQSNLEESLDGQTIGSTVSLILEIQYALAKAGSPSHQQDATKPTAKKGQVPAKPCRRQTRFQVVAWQSPFSNGSVGRSCSCSKMPFEAKTPHTSALGHVWPYIGSLQCGGGFLNSNALSR